MYQTRATTTGTLKRPRSDVHDDHAEQDLASADPDFLALSPRQRRKVDAAFRRALREVRKKRRKVGSGGEGSTAAEGTGAGFVPDDSEGGGGGFLPDDDGGFIPSPSPPTTHNITTTTTSEPSSAAIPNGFLPYSALPGIFASLGIEWDDDVLATFKGLSAASRGGGEGTSWGMDDNYVDLNDFRSVVAVLMTPEPQGEGQGDAEMEVEDEDEDEGDEYAQDESMDTASSDLSSDPEHDPTADGRRRRRRQPGRRGQPAPADDADANLLIPTSSTSSGTAQQRKLTREEKDWVARMWETLFTGTTLGRGESTRLLGKEQVRSWAERLGMEWSDQEVSPRSHVVE
ncbi:hypothetical protein QFC19_002495 [Naganishia cerealis]|uniref:Uncharacterized protein n=1 Tax=Naganishia cerealis TaxID=610337 RepID=A0ACC2W9C9_9TREE|nr:hypothetical protein QFC19_002495 [Naganishia cerealis]